MKVILGPVPCHSCGDPVTVVRRDVAYACTGHGRICSFESRSPHVVDEDGSTHICALTGEQAFDTMAAQEAPRSSGVSHRVSCHGDSGPVPRPTDRGRVASEV